MRLSCLAPAKINRELRVGGLRADGYHEIRSRMISIDLADTLTAEPADRLEFSCDDPAVPVGDDNLVVRAATLLAQRADRPARVRLRLEKKIPIGGGLGGGSSDAAATLRLLARLWSLPEDAPSLGALAAELGSDVPFFLTGGEAEVSGRGEIVTPLEDSTAVDVLLLVPPFSISTAAVYRAYAGRGTLSTRLDVAGDDSRFLGRNDLASAVLEVEPRMEAYASSAAEATPDSAISGSGSTIALCGVTRKASIALEVKHPEARIYRCRSLDRRDYRRLADPTGGLS